MSASDLLEELAAAGVRLEPARGGSLRLRARSAGVVTDDMRRRILAYRDELLIVLGGCPACGDIPFDQRQQCCWRCNWRRCKCGKQTGSPFLSCCIGCDLGAGQ